MKDSRGRDGRDPRAIKGADRASQTQESRLREARQAEALRENLRKRKAQTKAREAQPQDKGAPSKDPNIAPKKPPKK